MLSRRKIPLLMWALVSGLLINFFPINLPFASALSFLTWAIPLLVSCVFLLSRLRAMRFPWIIWLPWSLCVFSYLLTATAENAFQRSIMLLTPIIIGCAFSSLDVTHGVLVQADIWLRRFFLLLIFGVFLNTALSFLGLGRWSWAAGSMTVSLMAVWFIARYTFSGNKKDLNAWLLLAAVPVIFLTRMGILATIITLPSTLAPLGLRKRVITLGFICVAGLGVFQLESVQEKMFYSGRGTISEAFEAGLAMVSGESIIGGNLKDHSRSGMRLLLQSGIERNYWFGNGANATEAILEKVFNLSHPHNDWLRLQYDYGTLAMWLFALTLLAQSVHAYLTARRLAGLPAVFMYTGASAFIPMVMFMFTDNIILYVSWFGNLHFAMLGLGYAAARTKGLGRT